MHECSSAIFLFTKDEETKETDGEVFTKMKFEFPIHLKINFLFQIKINFLFQDASSLNCFKVNFSSLKLILILIC